jgi:hypothetical protein
VLQKSIYTNNRNSVTASFGYFPDAHAPLWKNTEEVLKKMTVFQYFNRPKRMAYHNLCVTQQPPKGIGITLGLGLKFCTQTSLPPPSLTMSFNCFTEDLRKCYMFAGSLKDLDTPKKMYIKNSEFVPESMCEHAEARLHNFISTIKNAKHHHQLNAKRSTNLTYLQQQHLKFLRNNQQFIILDADKNLGPCIMERDTYINLLLQEHLQNPNNTYSLLSEEDAFNNLQNTRLQFNAIFKKHEKSILPVEKLFFACTMNNPTRIPQFYGLPKIHKNKSPMPSRPVISQCGSYSAIISTYIDYKLQQLTPSIPSYIKNSASLLNKLDKLKSLPPNCKLFTSDATSMYTNIDPGEGVNTLCLYLNKYASEGKGSTLNKELVCELMKLVMENNIFQFGNSYWKQNVGTAMGTPCACIYATIFFAWFERERTMTKYKRNLILYCRQIDNIFGIWQHNREHPD